MTISIEGELVPVVVELGRAQKVYFEHHIGNVINSFLNPRNNVILRILATALCAALLLCGGSPAFAWGEKGHTLINSIAAASFPADLPPFLRSAAAENEIAYLGPQLDRLKGSGISWDDENDPGHFVDLLDNGTIGGAVSLAQMPSSREAYDTALRAAGTDQYRQGYLPYALLDGWEQVREDFAYWRVDRHLRRSGAQSVDETMLLRDIGVWGHFVGDASQPLHATVHFNGWGNFPNPAGYSQARSVHAMFESDFVNRYLDAARVHAFVQPRAPFAVNASLVTGDQAMAVMTGYLLTTNRTVSKLYQIEKAGGFSTGSPDAVRFTASRLAAGAMELRDLVVWAWDDSLNERIGYPSRSVRDILAGQDY